MTLNQQMAPQYLPISREVGNLKYRLHKINKNISFHNILIHWRLKCLGWVIDAGLIDAKGIDLAQPIWL